MPVFAAEIPIRIVPAALLPPSAELATSAAAAMTAATIPATVARFLMLLLPVWVAERPSTRHSRARPGMTVGLSLPFSFLAWSSARGPPSVHEDALPVDVSRAVGSEEHRERGDVLDHTDSPV